MAYIKNKFCFKFGKRKLATGDFKTKTEYNCNMMFYIFTQYIS